MKPYYEHEGITIYHGDCREVLPQLDPVDLVITDPPYFQPVAHYCPARDNTKPRRSMGDRSVLALAFGIWCDAIAGVIRPTGTAYIFCDGQSYPIVFDAMYSHAHRIRPLIWDKVTSFNGYTWRHQHELIAWAEMSEAVRVKTGDGDILRFRAVPVKERLHPAQKPTELVRRLMAKHDAGTVLDPFAGSGTALVVARMLDRNAIGIEIEERYCEIAANRLAQEVLQFEKVIA